MKISQVDKEGAEDLDPALASVQEFARITGKRAKKVADLIADCEGTLLGTKLIVLFIVDEAVRLLVQEFLRGDTAEPRLFTISNPERSPLTAVCQYLSSLLLCDSPRLVLIFGREGHATTSEWEEKRPGLCDCNSSTPLLYSLTVVELWCRNMGRAK